MTDILQKIGRQKKEEIARAKAATPLATLEAKARAASPVRPFKKSLLEAEKKESVAVIAEIKKASPSKGIIRSDFAPPSLALSLEKGGAAALSILTDESFFQGSLHHLIEAKRAAALPCLRKDFFYDAYQVVEARVWGADSILIIMAALGKAQAKDINAAAKDWNMDVIFEAHDEKELETALHLGAQIVGLNSRNLKNFETSLETTLRLADALPQDVLGIAESGIASHDDILRFQEKGIRSFLVGEHLMRAHDPGWALQELLGKH